MSVYNDKRVIAGVVLTQNEDIESAKLIAIATGTRMIDNHQYDAHCSAINDSHAEVIVRRCLIHYLYSELELHCDNDDKGKKKHKMFF